MARLPQPGQDSGTWGDVLNDFLSTSLNTDGTLKPSAVTNSGAASDATVVHNSTNETISGVKTFSTSPIVPTPTAPTQATTKAYVDSTVSAGAPDASTTTKGIVKLAGDLSGTALLPTVPGLASKEPTITAGTTSQYYRGDKTFQTLDKTAVGLVNVDNTSDANKPVSSATTTALNLKLDKSVATTKGDLLAATAASTIARVGVGTDGQVLTADTASAPGVKWSTPTAAPVTSVVGQTGVITGAQIAGDGALTSTYGPPNIQPTGIAATDTAAIQAAHDALPVAGGEIRLMAGTYVLTSTGLSFSKSVKLRGTGKSAGGISTAGNYNADTAITRIEYNSATGTAITVSANACLFQDFHLINTSVSAPTAGAGIAVSTGGGVGFEYRSISVAGFYRNIDHGNGFEWVMDGCTIFDYVQAGIRIANPVLPDGGDMGISNCQIMAGPNRSAAVAGIEWISAGGLRVTSCKFNKRGTGTSSVGIYLHPADGISTSVFQINDNSFENMNYGIYSDDASTTGTGLISKVNIKDNEFLCATKAVALTRATAAKTSLVQIKDNIITGGNTAGIQLINISIITVGGNLFAPNITAAGKLTLGAGVSVLTNTDPLIYTEAGAATTGTAVLNGTTSVVVATASVTASSVILMTQQVAGGTQSGIAYVKSRIAGTSFTIASVAGDTSTVGWQIIEPLV